MLTADTNLLIHAADPDSPYHEAARAFFIKVDQGKEEFVICELVLVELYMQLRNPAILSSLTRLRNLRRIAGALHILEA